jgi:hypothetical protein
MTAEMYPHPAGAMSGSEPREGTATRTYLTSSFVRADVQTARLFGTARVARVRVGRPSLDVTISRSSARVVAALSL